MSNMEIITRRLSNIPDVLAAAPETTSWELMHDEESTDEGEEILREGVIYTRRELPNAEFGYVKDGIETVITAKRGSLSFLRLSHDLLNEEIIVVCKPSVTTHDIVTMFNTRIAEIEIDNQPKHQPEDYRAIAFWGEYLRSLSGYIKMEQRRASEQNAPLNAIYERNGYWQTLDKVENPIVIKAAKARGLL